MYVLCKQLRSVHMLVLQHQARLCNVIRLNMRVSIYVRMGVHSNCRSVYDRACKLVSAGERHDLYIHYINKATEFFGVTKTRPIYETAMQFVPDSRIKDLCVKYAELEMTLGEIDRARAVFQYGSQHCDPGKVSGRDSTRVVE